MRPARADEAGDEGSGTVLVVAVVAVVVVLAGMLGALAGSQAAGARAQAAADLAALAAAARIAAPPTMSLDPSAVGAADPCGTARDVALRNRADLQECTVLADGVVQVEVVVGARSVISSASARARAGPRSAAPD